MEAIQVYKTVTAASLSMATDGRKVTVWPGDRLTDPLRLLIRTHKPELIQLLAEAHATASELIEAAMRACDHHGDNQAARDQMARDVQPTPLHLRQDLLDHLNQTYPKGGKQ